MHSFFMLSRVGYQLDQSRKGALSVQHLKGLLVLSGISKEEGDCDPQDVDVFILQQAVDQLLSDIDCVLREQRRSVEQVCAMSQVILGCDVIFLVAFEES